MVSETFPYLHERPETSDEETYAVEVLAAEEQNVILQTLNVM